MKHLPFIFLTASAVCFVSAGNRSEYTGLSSGTDRAVIQAVDLAALETAILDTQHLIGFIDEGLEEGQVPPGSEGVLQSAIDAAAAFALSDLSAATQAQVQAETDALYDACSRFESGVQVSGIHITDMSATRETRYLFDNLRIRAEYHLMFGMHDATGYGVGWNNDLDRSDVNDVCGDFPAVYSWDLTRITWANNIADTRYQMTTAFAKGSINTMCWHQRDPLGRGFYSEDVNDERIVATLLPGGLYHDSYKNKLKTAARFFKSLRGSHGQSIPVIFRPYHEHDGSWFWWGDGHCTAEEYVGLWRFTIAYLRDSLNVHNLLYAYSPGTEGRDSTAYLERYPGDAYVDILGMDHYYYYPVTTTDQAYVVDKVRDLARMALNRNKVAAWTEVGQRDGIPTGDWFTRILLEPIKTDSLAAFVSYAAVWRNAGTDHHFAPYPGHPSVPDFLKFYEDPYTVFEADLPDMYSRAGADIAPPEFVRAPPSPWTVHFTAFELVLETNERAFLRLGMEDLPYDDMTEPFQTGQGGRFHSTWLTGIQGETVPYYIQARDTCGNTTQNAAIISVTVDTLMRPVFWKDREYPDSEWPLGPAPLGYGNSGDRTVTGGAHTLYFRTHFNLDTIPGVLGLLVKCHDAAVAYVNGFEIGRTNLAEGQVISHGTHAQSEASTNRVFIFDTEALSMLRTGDNVIAVELHAADADQTDLSLDAQLFNPDGVFIPLGAAWHYNDDDIQPANATLRDILTGAADPHSSSPGSFVLYPNFPNPFNTVTRIRFHLPGTSEVRLTVFDILGRELVRLKTEPLAPGMHRMTFDGSVFPSGIYMAELRAGREISRQKMLLLK
ncbi:T9SS type A sorting domain-containing protein [bacterium]|nr:T9SS type A sorting domain-containing protein [bacterium]